MLTMVPSLSRSVSDTLPPGLYLHGFFAAISGPNLRDAGSPDHWNLTVLNTRTRGSSLPRLLKVLVLIVRFSLKGAFMCLFRAFVWFSLRECYLVTALQKSTDINVSTKIVACCRCCRCSRDLETKWCNWFTIFRMIADMWTFRSGSRRSSQVGLTAHGWIVRLFLCTGWQKLIRSSSTSCFTHCAFTNVMIDWCLATVRMTNRWSESFG